jgi:cbb3-type cytochrome oxidase subunit 3
MSTYETVQRFVAAWGFAYFGAIFAVAVGFALWPSRQRAMDEAALIPLRDD